LGTPRIEDAADDMLMIEPPPLFSIPGMKAFIVRCIDFTLRSNEKSMSCSDESSTLP